MSTFATYSALHPVTFPAARSGPSGDTNSSIRRSVRAPHCSFSRSQDEVDNFSNLSTVHYDTNNENQWLNRSYMDLRMRSNSLIHSEVSHALQQHFHHEEKADVHSERKESSYFYETVSRTNSLHLSKGESHEISGLVVFDTSMFARQDGSSFMEQYGHLVNGFHSGVSSFMDEPFC